MGNDLWQTTLFGLLPFPWTIHTYGLLIAIGFLLGVQLAKDQAIREGLDGEEIVDTTFYLLLWGLVGGRLVFMATVYQSFIDDPWEILRLWRGGLVWYGGFFGAVGYLWRQAHVRRLPFFQLVDLFIIPTALAHAYGRLGCLAAGCCHGAPTSMPWGIIFPPHSFAQAEQAAQRLVAPLASSLPVHPTQLYEATAEFALFAWLVWARPRKRYHGQLFLLWLSVYPVVRTIIEIFRGDKERGVWVLSTSQYLSIGVGMAAIALFVALRRKMPRAGNPLA